MLESLSLLAVLLVPRVEMLKAEVERSPAITVPELRAHVYRLASREFLGRSGPGAARAAQHLADTFERLGLMPAFGGSYIQAIPWLVGRPGSFAGRNVAAVLPGSDPKLESEWVLLCAHFDHLGPSGESYYPGADDNGSGVAMLLEVAEHFTLRGDRPRRTIVFVAFDQEETGLLGSTHFAAHPPLPFRRLKAALVADMIGRSMANVMDEYVFALGSETSPQLRRLVETVALPEGLKAGRLGADVIGTRSDYGPFRDRRVPFLFFSTGQHPDYHRVTDLPDRIDYEKLRRISAWIAALTERLANTTEPPRWDSRDLALDLEEAKTVLCLVTRVLDRPAAYPLSGTQRELLRGTQDRLTGIVKRGAITSGERQWLVWSARLLLATVF
jgi:hypothetical protein